jgi:hypothetical protein
MSTQISILQHRELEGDVEVVVGINKFAALNCEFRVQDIPAAFMRCYHEQMYTIVRLRGPNAKVIKVKLFKCHYVNPKNEFRYYFGTGWRAFCDSNKLRAGDRVRFSLEEPSHFVVDRV